MIRQLEYHCEDRSVNAQTKKNVWQKPNADTMMGRLSGTKTSFNLDFFNGNWQFPLKEGSQSCQYFHAPFVLFAPNLVLLGGANAVCYFQSPLLTVNGAKFI